MILQIITYFYLMLSSAISIRQTRIVGGHNADIVDFPYHASLRRLSDFRHICGGAIISQLHILTAAHCITNEIMNHAIIAVYIGSANSCNNECGSIVDIDSIYPHPEFVPDPMDISTFQNDIAVIKLTQSIEFNEFQNKVNLPVSDIFNGDFGYLSGWGSTTYPSDYLSDTLQKTWMTVIDNYLCEPHLPFHIHSGQFCAYQGMGVGPCIGDSGSPLVNLNTIMGIASFCRLCATGSPDVYTRVYTYVDFIIAALQA